MLQVHVPVFHFNIFMNSMSSFTNTGSDRNLHTVSWMVHCSTSSLTIFFSYSAICCLKLQKKKKNDIWTYVTKKKKICDVLPENDVISIIIHTSLENYQLPTTEEQVTTYFFFLQAT